MMLQKSSLQFLKDLRRHNQKDWFDKNRARYDRAKEDLENFTAGLIRSVGKFDESVAHLEVKDCLFRINRDVRFSKDKSPYKNHLALYLSKGGKKATYAGYYMHIEPGNSRLSGGLWLPAPPDLKKIRQEIDYNLDEFEKICKAKKFQKTFGGFQQNEGVLLSRPPKGYDEDNPAIPYLKYKSWVVTAHLSDADLLSGGLGKKVTAYCETLYPLNQFFNKALDE